MESRTSTQDAGDRTRSELALLVETEARLDRELAAARERAAALHEAARRRVEQAEATLAAEITAERARIATEIEHATAAQLREMADAAQREITRFDAVAGEQATEVARRIAAQWVAAIAAEDTP